jgi:VanZ family protein
VNPGEPLDVPWFLPGFAISIVVGIAVSGIVARTLCVKRAVGWAIVMSLGIIVAATLTPRRQGLEYGALGASSCDLSRLGPAPIQDLVRPTESLGNIMMFIPLGATIGLVPRSRRKAVLVVGAIALPFAIETAQLLLPVLDRACESADVVDNLTGLVVGFGGGVVAGQLWRSRARRTG